MVNTEELQKTINQNSTLFWHRRDLRIADNAGLYRALKNEKNIIPIFIFDSVILDNLEKNDSRVDFIYQSIKKLKEEYEKLGSTLIILYGNPVDIFKKLSSAKVYCNHDYEPYALKRDGEVEQLLQKKNISFHSFKDHVIFEKDEVIKDDGKPYTVFTPYSKKWKSKLNPFYVKKYPTENYTHNVKKMPPAILPGMEEFGFENSGIIFPERKIRTKLIEDYHNTRDFPGIEGTSRLSVHLRFGTVSIRQLSQVALNKNETWLNELIWRDFYQMILWHFPHVVTEAFKPQYDYIEWRNDEGEFKRWCEGMTGYPIVDAGMRELNQTGFMHNRARMIVASFLTKNLLIDWRWGEAYFSKKLLDFDLASNNGGWQWAAGSGCDAAPYFRVFNPYIQTEKFDPKQDYINKWVPEVNTPAYPKPIVDHAHASDRVLEAFKRALQPVQ